MPSSRDLFSSETSRASQCHNICYYFILWKTYAGEILSYVCGSRTSVTFTKIDCGRIAGNEIAFLLTFNGNSSQCLRFFGMGKAAGCNLGCFVNNLLRERNVISCFMFRTCPCDVC